MRDPEHAQREEADHVVVEAVEDRGERGEECALPVERVGYDNPIASANETGLKLEMERISYWKDRGAKLSDTVAMLVKRSAGAASKPAAEPAAAA